MSIFSLMYFLKSDKVHTQVEEKGHMNLKSSLYVLGLLNLGFFCERAESED